MGGITLFIKEALEAVGELIADAVKTASTDVPLARTKLQRFTVLTRATLRGDRAEAERILDERFEAKPIPVDLYDEIDDMSPTSD